MASAVAAVAPAAAAESLAANPYSSGEAGPDTDPIAAAEAVRSVGIALGRGIAGLVNALDPDLVTLGGLGVDLLATVPEAIESAYRDGLMLIHRGSPPPILPAALPDDEGPIAGAAEEAWSALLPRLA
jgi:predicted NBD/HSP70 family sugar kinase